MKFLVAKKDNIKCYGCQATIQRGDDMVLNFIRSRRNGSQAILTYHVLCYLSWYTEMFNQKWSDWKNGEGNIKRPDRGRPVMFTEPTTAQKINRLRSNLCYHKKLGHNTKVKIIEGKIAGLLL